MRVERMDTIEDRLISFAEALRFRDIDPAVLRAFKQRFIDAIGCALGAFGAEPVSMARKIASRVQSSPGATVIGTREKSSIELAGFANTAMIRCLDLNDDYFGKDGPHPSDTIGAVLAAAESIGADGETFIEGAVVSYETLCRLADAVGLRDLGWDYVTFTSVAAALGVGKVLGLSREQLRNAVSLAVVANCALGQTRLGELSMWKGLASANACRNGIFAAQLAKEGVTAPEKSFEGKNGIEKQITGRLDLSSFGTQPLRAGVVYLKNWPVFYTAQLPLQTALAIRQNVAVEQISKIIVESYKRLLGRGSTDPERWRPASRETADHSLPFCVAAALLDGDVTLSTFESSRFLDSDIVELMAKVELREDPEFTRQYPEVWNCRITVHLRSGEPVIMHSVYPKGHPKNPFSDAEVEEKFICLAESLLTRAQCQRFFDFAWRVEETSDVGELLRVLAPG
jgi:2-methylcitrate dehydratase